MSRLLLKDVSAAITEFIIKKFLLVGVASVSLTNLIGESNICEPLFLDLSSFSFSSV